MPIDGSANVSASLSKIDETYELEQFIIEFQKFSLSFTGSGDLFTALLTAWLTRSGETKWPSEMDVSSALEKTIATMQAVLNRTALHYNNYTLSKCDAIQISALKELKIIQSRDDILNPQIRYRAKRMVPDA